ncbi:MAG: MATE family efflux transporter [Ruminococcaceae bacterium]|nr:MATE family efflux transporter [Oscillospiraceae bacterium]
MKKLDQQKKQFEKMTTEKVPGLIVSLGIPTIISMLVTSVYNMADTYFVSKLGTASSAAVGVVFSIMAIIQAVGFTLGMGSGSVISRLLGEQKNEEANRVASSGLFAALLFGVVLTVFGLVFLNPLMKLLGASESILPHARAYGKYILLGAPIMASSFVLNNVLRSQGKAKLAMIGLTTGGILNILLDPLFIFTFQWGTAGAAIATLASQCVSFLILLSMFLRKKSVVHLSVKNISAKSSVYFAIIKTGLPSFCRQGLASISTVALNHSAGFYGDYAIAGMSIVSKIFMMLFSVSLGIGQGYQPVAGYNYGAKKFDRVKHAIWFTFTVGLMLMTFFGVLMFFLAPQVMNWFIEDSQAAEFGTRALRWQCCSLPFITVGVMCNMTFQSIGKCWTATFLSSARQGYFFLPLIFLLPMFFGETGVQMTQACSDILTSLLCLPFGIRFMRFLSKEDASVPRQEELKLP